MPIDPNIWKLIAQDDREAYAIMYKYYFSRFYNYGKKFVLDTILIEDAAQEALLIIWEKRASIPELKFAVTYFYTTFRNILITKIKQKSLNQLPIDSFEEPGLNAEQLILQKEAGEQIKLKLELAIKDLTPRQREAIFLRFYEGLTFEEVASVLNITTKATYKIVYRALSNLKEILIYPSLVLLALLVEIVAL